jgi:hypothetical protein
MHKKMIWPIHVTAITHDHSGRKHTIDRTVEGAGDAVGAMLHVIMNQKHPDLWLGVGIRGVTQLGQRIEKIFEYNEDKGYFFIQG